MRATAPRQQISSLIAGIVPSDDLERQHRDIALAWIASTTDLFRREKPATPDPHLVSYFLLTDMERDSVLLVDHIKAGLWLPTGGHVEPGEHPAATVLREAREELGIDAQFSALTGRRPLFITVTTTQSVVDKHTDVSRWFMLDGHVSQPLTPDPNEFRSARWWTRRQLAAADPAMFDPHQHRALTKLEALSRV